VELASEGLVSECNGPSLARGLANEACDRGTCERMLIRMPRLTACRLNAC